MNNFFCALLFLIALISPQHSIAQIAGDCAFLARDGVMTKTDWQKSTNAKLIILSRISTMSLSDATDTLSHVGQVEVGPIKIGPGSWNKDKHEQLKTELSKLVNIDQILNNQESLLVSSGDPVVADLIKRCIEAHGGLTMVLRKQSDAIAIADITFWPYPLTPPNFDPVVEDFTALSSNGTKAIVEGGPEYTRRGRRLGVRKTSSVTLRHELKSDLVVTFNTSAGSSTGYLAPPLSPPPLQVARRCEDYMRDHARTAACNNRTENGYYWEIKQPRISPYAEEGAVSGVPGEYLVPCNEAAASVSSSGVTIRYPPAHGPHDAFLPVYSNWTLKGKMHPEDQECGGKDICGKFLAICRKQELPNPTGAPRN